ncbi:MAG: hypothetical protein H7Z74_16825 [Anaerolineae bacterium]|nr:hypothetical protein [Gemmatimonadaceae bacterium]
MSSRERAPPFRTLFNSATRAANAVVITLSTREGTMSLDPTLGALRSDLQRLGFVVVPHGDHICVRLSMLASVRVRIAEGALQLQPQFGPLQRATALLLGVVGIPAVAVAAFAAFGLEPVTLAAGAGGVAYLFSDAYRLILTESCMTRLQLLWAAHASDRNHEMAFAASSSLRQLAEQPPNESLALAGSRTQSRSPVPSPAFVPSAAPRADRSP